MQISPLWEERITCTIPGTRNPHGIPKVLAIFTEQGILCYCPSCRVRHLVSWERCMTAHHGIEQVPCPVIPDSLEIP